MAKEVETRLKQNLAINRSALPSKWTYIFIALGVIALVYQISLLIRLPWALPFTPDDLWSEWKASTHSLRGLAQNAFGFARGQGRLAIIGQVFLSSASYMPESYLLRLALQSLPLLVCSVLGPFLCWLLVPQRPTVALGFLTMVGLGSFFEEQHHLFGAYPVGIPTGLSLCFLYLILRLRLIPRLDIRHTWLFAGLFVAPLLIYEYFLFIQAAALLVVLIYPTTRIEHEGKQTLLRARLGALMPELIALLAWGASCALNSIMRREAEYAGAVISPDFASIPTTLLTFATGFFGFTTGWDLVAVIGITAWLLVFMRKNGWSKSVVPLYFFVIWLIPPFMLSITPKYQEWARAGVEIYTTSFVSEIGVFGLCSLLLVNHGELKRLALVMALSGYMLVTWHAKSEDTIRRRIARFQNLDLAIAESASSTSKCVSHENALARLSPWTVCHAKDSTCSNIVSMIVNQRGGRVCE